MNKFDGLVLNTTGIYALEFVSFDGDELTVRKHVVLGWCPSEFVGGNGTKYDSLEAVWINRETGEPEIAGESGENYYLTNGEDPPWRIRAWAERVVGMRAELKEEEASESEFVTVAELREEEKKEKEKEKKKREKRETPR